MNLDDVIYLRHSVRSYASDDVPDDLLEELIAKARRSPSAGAIRGYKALVSRELHPHGAPVCVVICIDQEAYGPRYGARGRELYALQDAAIFGAYLQLLLTDRGLSSCWVGAFSEDRVKVLVKTDLRPVAVIAIGYKI